MNIIYSVTEEAGRLLFEWPGKRYGGWMIIFGFFLLIAAVFTHRHRESLREKINKFPSLSRFSQRYPSLVTRALGLLSLFTIVLAFFLPPGPVIRWHLTLDALILQSGNKEAVMPWNTVQTIRLDPQQKNSAKSPIIFQDDQGQETWLVLKWLIPEHRRRLIRWLTAKKPEAMEPLLANTFYMESLKKN